MLLILSKENIANVWFTIYLSVIRYSKPLQAESSLGNGL